MAGVAAGQAGAIPHKGLPRGCPEGHEREAEGPHPAALRPEAGVHHLPDRAGAEEVPQGRGDRYKGLGGFRYRRAGHGLEGKEGLTRICLGVDFSRNARQGGA